jgi:hypothetical protein
MMGGFGSGGCNRSGRETVEEQHSLSVSELLRHGVLVDGWRGGWQWTSRGSRVGAIALVGGRQQLRLRYRVQVDHGDWRPIDETVMLVWRACRYGGERPYLLCPGCSRVVLKLHLTSHIFRCRRCQRLSYASQRERDHHRALRRARRLRERLGENAETGAQIPPRPKRMDRRTYDRLAHEIEELEAAADDDAALLFLRVAERIQRRSSRSFWSWVKASPRP